MSLVPPPSPLCLLSAASAPSSSFPEKRRRSPFHGQSTPPPSHRARSVPSFAPSPTNSQHPVLVSGWGGIANRRGWWVSICKVWVMLDPSLWPSQPWGPSLFLLSLPRDSPVACSKSPPWALSRGSDKLLHCGAARRRASRRGMGRGPGPSHPARGARLGRRGCPSVRAAPGTCTQHPGHLSFLTWGRPRCAGEDAPAAAAVAAAEAPSGGAGDQAARCRCRRHRFGELSSQPIAREAGDVRQPPPGLQATPQAPTPTPRPKRERESHCPACSQSRAPSFPFPWGHFGAVPPPILAPPHSA